MAGGLIQLVAHGTQDIYLTGKPQITFFKVVYRRHTNFAVESIEQTFSGSINFSRKATAEIARNGDLITQAFLKVVLPEVRYNGAYNNLGHVQFAWVKNLGHAIVDYTELDIGGSTIDKQYGDWLQIWQELSGSVGHRHTLARLLGDVPELTSISTLSWHDANNTVLKPSSTLYVPLQFYFCRNNGLALPLIALQYHQVKIHVKFRPVEQCYIASDAFKQGAGNLDLDEASILMNYVFLDTEERRRFAQVSHEYLIEQLQFAGEDVITGSGGKHKLSFNHPVKSIYWVTKMGNYQGGRFMVYDHCNWENARKNAAKLLLLAQFDLSEFGHFNDVMLNSGDHSYIGENQVEYVAVDPGAPSEDAKYTFENSATASAFDGTVFIGVLSHNTPLLRREKDNDLRSKVEGVIRIHTEMDDHLMYPRVEKITKNDLTMHDLSTPVDRFKHDNRNNYIKRFDLTVWQHDNFGLLIDGSVNPTTDAELHLNGQPRQSRRSGTWHDTVVPFMHHTKRSQKDGINVFAFAINPQEHQPSCTCNFSRVDAASLNLAFNELANKRYADVFANTANRVHIFGVNYNVLRIMSGMAGTAYSN